jgi:formate-dependent phosphoribosylglycinamide formyltransferase (GAR transformylase)
VVSAVDYLCLIDNYVNSPKFHRKRFTSVAQFATMESSRDVVNQMKHSCIVCCGEAIRLEQMQQHVGVSAW